MSQPPTDRLAELEAAVQIRDDQLAVIAHDLRGPLSSVMLLLQRVRDEVDKHDQVAATAIKPNLDQVAKRLEQYVHHLDKLLEASRIESHGVAPTPEPIDLAALVRDTVADLRGARFRPQVVEVTGEEALVGRWDRQAVEQIVRNLVANALQYDDDGPIGVHVAADKASATLTVKDRGPGVADADRARIFDKFVRAGKGKGFGLGLWIARRAAEAMGGAVTVEGAGKGAEFKLVLPRGLSRS